MKTRYIKPSKVRGEHFCTPLCAHLNNIELAIKANTKGTVSDGKVKRCSVCLKFKPVSEFFKNNYTRDGLNCGCKECDP